MIKRLLFIMLMFLAVAEIYGQGAIISYDKDISYFIPQYLTEPAGEKYLIQQKYNPDIPQPKEILGYEVGERYADWGDIVNYMSALDQASPRITVSRLGFSYEKRPFLEVVITSEKNHSQIGKIREQHLALTDPARSAELDCDNLPVVVMLTNSIHGNEASAVNSTLVTSYLLAASEDEKIRDLLENTIIIIAPGLNPDGINRFANWVNTNSSHNSVSDLSAREFNECWPNSRTNHYWIDCNRDWLMCQHPEGINAVELYLKWMPNVLSDHHEMTGDVKGFYFSPGHPDRTHQYIPQENQNLASAITHHVAKSLETIGSLYYSKEAYDDFYFGKGAAYVDFQGSVGILYEQVASRGYSRPLPGGMPPLDFPFTVRNQVHAALMTIYGTFNMKERLLSYQRDFYIKSGKAAKSDPVKGYIFNTGGVKSVEYHFLENMRHHKIDLYRIEGDVTVDGGKFNSESSYVVPLQQKHYWKIKAMWEEMTQFKDSIFYDISTWTIPYAFNLNYAKLKELPALSDAKVADCTFSAGTVVGGKSDYAYIFENKELYSYNLMNDLLEKGVFVRISKRPFRGTIKGTERSFGYGTAIVQVQNQPLGSDGLYSLVKESAERNGVEVYSSDGGMMADLDLGTLNNRVIDKPRVAMLSGSGMGVTESGEIWFMLDRRFGMAPSIIDFNTLHKADLSRYSVIVAANGLPDLPVSEKSYLKLKEWVDNGGTLIVTGKSYLLPEKIGVASFKTRPLIDEECAVGRYGVYDKQDTFTNSVPGVIMMANLDLTSPLGYGCTKAGVPIFKKGNVAFDPVQNEVSVPLYYSEEPYLSGCISERGVERFVSTPAAMVAKSGKGRTICFADNLNFRSYWFGATKIFMNAIYFGQLY